LIFFSLFSLSLCWTFISLQIKEFRIMGLSINDSLYSCLFFLLTGLHFFHLLLGLLLLSLLFWSCSFSYQAAIFFHNLLRGKHIESSFIYRNDFYSFQYLLSLIEKHDFKFILWIYHFLIFIDLEIYLFVDLLTWGFIGLSLSGS